jgi:hypothetical protein
VELEWDGDGRLRGDESIERLPEHLLRDTPRLEEEHVAVVPDRELDGRPQVLQDGHLDGHRALKGLRVEQLTVIEAGIFFFCK